MATKDDEQELEWTKDLPSKEELTPLSHSLISRMMANAFRIKHDEPMTEEDVQRESKSTFHNIFKQKSTPSFDLFPTFQEQENASGYGRYGVEGRRVVQEDRGNRAGDEFRGEFRGNLRVGKRRDGRAHAVEDGMDYNGAFRSEIPRQPCASGNDLGKGGVKSNAGVGGAGSHGATNTATNTGREYGNGADRDTDEQRPLQTPLPGRLNSLPYQLYEDRPEGDDSRGGEGLEPKSTDFDLEDANLAGGSMSEDPNSKRPARIVWTPQLHQRFVEAVGHLGIKNAVPKTIMQLMNVEGLTRENVASHLQKYRLHLKHMQAGHFSDGPSASDHLFSSTPLPPGNMPPGMSPHFMPMASSREDGGATAFAIPMPFQGMVRPGPFGGYEHVPYGPMAGGYMPRPPMPNPRMVMPEHSASRSQSQQNIPSLSSHGALPLFPTNQGS